ncbi:ribonuclease HII [Candidatus Pacearchaeota archaeon]|nr:ribonuclease HII [Candidatus Pacearchaeota archaeon]
MLILGIDDAGRGPIIGPMVLAGVLIEKKDEAHLRKIGVKDSKKVTPKRREILAVEIKKIAKDYHASITLPLEIDSRALNGLNLNNIEAIKSAEIINKLNKSQERIEVVIDCPSPNIPKWREYILKHIHEPDNLIFKVEHKADVNHIACSAASIIAKVTRDSEIEEIKKRIGVDFGSGYPSDPVTISFLQKHGKKYKKEGIIRETWQTWQNFKGKKEQKNLKDF